MRFRRRTACTAPRKCKKKKKYIKETWPDDRLAPFHSICPAEATNEWSCRWVSPYCENQNQLQINYFIGRAYEILFALFLREGIAMHNAFDVGDSDWIINLFCVFRASKSAVRRSARVREKDGVYLFIAGRSFSVPAGADMPWPQIQFRDENEKAAAHMHENEQCKRCEEKARPRWNAHPAHNLTAIDNDVERFINIGFSILSNFHSFEFYCLFSL